MSALGPFKFHLRSNWQLYDPKQWIAAWVRVVPHDDRFVRLVYREMSFEGREALQRNAGALQNIAFRYCAVHAIQQLKTHDPYRRVMHKGRAMEAWMYGVLRNAHSHRGHDETRSLKHVIRAFDIDVNRLHEYPWVLSASAHKMGELRQMGLNLFR